MILDQSDANQEPQRAMNLNVTYTYAAVDERGAELKEAHATVAVKRATHREILNAVQESIGERQIFDIKAIRETSLSVSHFR